MKDKLFDFLLKSGKIIFKIFAVVKFIIIKVYEYLKLVYKNITSSIRMEVIFTFIVCIFLSTLIYFGTSIFIKTFTKRIGVDYSDSIRRIEQRAEGIRKGLSNKEFSIKDKGEIEKLINNYLNNDKITTKILIVNLNGEVLYNTEKSEEMKVDIHLVIKKAMESRRGYRYLRNIESMNNSRDSSEFIYFSIVNFKENMAYLIYKDIPIGKEKVIGYKQEYHIVIPVILSVISFFLLFYAFTIRKMNYIKEISQGLVNISKGNLEYRVPLKGKDELSSLAENINYMSKTLKNKIEEERRAETTKNELITNVSHDLRTPLTSIIGYLGLIKERKYEDNQQLDEYSNIVFNKSEKLKVLMDDLFEYTKMTNKGINLIKHRVVINELISQLIEEFVPIFSENSLELEKEFIDKKIQITLDPDKTVRVFENLLMNALKYSYKPGKVKVKIYKDSDNAVVCIENKGENISKKELEKLFDRFYKVDKSRTSELGGSGLGLAIAKSIVEIQGGSIWVECKDENIYFFVSFKI